MLAAGFETTSNTLSTLCYNLARYPDVLNTLLQEVDEITEKFDGVVDHETIADMPYLDACIKVCEGREKKWTDLLLSGEPSDVRASGEE